MSFCRSDCCCCSFSLLLLCRCFNWFSGMRYAALFSTSGWLFPLTCWSHDCRLLCVIYHTPCIFFPHRIIVSSLVVCISCSVAALSCWNYWRSIMVPVSTPFGSDVKKLQTASLFGVALVSTFETSWVPFGDSVACYYIELLDLPHLWWFGGFRLLASIFGSRQCASLSVVSWLMIWWCWWLSSSRNTWASRIIRSIITVSTYYHALKQFSSVYRERLMPQTPDKTLLIAHLSWPPIVALT
jgi:hypothetical protein